MDSLAFYVSDLRKHFVRFCNEKLEYSKLTEGLFHFLIYIGKKPNCSMGEIAEYLHMDNGHTTRSITRLQQLGYVQRRVDVEDKRKGTLQLTIQGQQVFEDIKNLVVEWDRMVMQDLSNDEKQHLYHLLQKIAIV